MKHKDQISNDTKLSKLGIPKKILLDIVRMCLLWAPKKRYGIHSSLLLQGVKIVEERLIVLSKMMTVKEFLDSAKEIQKTDEEVPETIMNWVLEQEEKKSIRY